MRTRITLEHSSKNVMGLGLAAIGVVYGDIGTSPLYAFRESLAAASGGGTPVPEAIFGVLSLVLWALLIIVTFKYVMLLLRADNHGEGGILSLMALARDAVSRRSSWVVTLGIIGTSLFYGDAMITPAISVLSAIEGLQLITDSFHAYVMPISLTIIFLLFLAQRRGTEKVARFFGPIMLLWFVVIAVGALPHIAERPEVWRAINPYYAIEFLLHHHRGSLIALGAVFLSVTGAEALYADMGHFGKRPIRLAWLYVVMPALILNYAGQAALVLENPNAAAHSFFLLYPDWALLPMVILATLATVIASQAVITGAFSLTHQAMQLGLLPRLYVRFTSHEHFGQIFMPQVNWLIFAGVVMLMQIFRSSSALASAYGIAVTGTMVITAILAFIVMRHVWKWSPLLVCIIVAPLLLIDLSFFTANLTKFFEGGFMPILFSALVVLMMQTWVRGTVSLHEQTRDPECTMEGMLANLKSHPPHRVEGVAFYLTSNEEYAPSALLQNLKHNHVLHARNFLITMKFMNVPFVPESERIEIEEITSDFTRIFLHFGFMQTPNVSRALKLLRVYGVSVDLEEASFFISRRNIVPSASFGMPSWRDRLFIAMAHNASDVANYFHIPPARVVELGVQMTV